MIKAESIATIKSVAPTIRTATGVSFGKVFSEHLFMLHHCFYEMSICYWPHEANNTGNKGYYWTDEANNTISSAK
ncbi:hypothetical protein JCM12296A_60550 [Desulfosarcina cetonica]